jgi:hypothetical protein
MRSAVSILRAAIGASCISALASFSVQAEELAFGSLLLPWPDGFSVISERGPIELKGPDGAKMLVTVMRPRSEPPPAAAAAEQEKMAGGCDAILRPQAEKVGAVVVPFERLTLSSGTILCQAGSRKAGVFGDTYFLQYMFVSPTGRMGFVTVEGKGDVSVEHAKYADAIRSVHWKQ